jgi:Misato Segment II tubulin-like domain
MWSEKQLFSDTFLEHSSRAHASCAVFLITDSLQEAYFTYSDNEQPAIDHDVHFRAGIGAGGSETFTPRTVIYDLKGGFGSLRKYNALYELSEDNPAPNVLW